MKRRETADDHHLSNMVEAMLWHANGPLVFIDDVTADRSSRTNCESYKVTLCSDSTECYKTDQTVLHSDSG